MIENRLRQLHLIRICLLLPIPLYCFLAIRAPQHTPPTPAFYNMILILAVVEGGVAVFLRSKLSKMADELWQKSPESKAALSRWFSSNIVPWALCLSVALYGLVMRYAGSSLREVSPFFAAGFVLMLCFPPRRPVEMR